MNPAHSVIPASPISAHWLIHISQAASSLLQKHKALFVLLFFALGLRVALISTGGQLFWPDESRYFRSVNVLRNLADGGPKPAIDYLFSSQEHIGFTFVGFFPAVIQFVTRTVIGASNSDTVQIPALVLSTASVAIIALVYALTLKLGLSRRAAFLAAALIACANTMFYWARHLVPYDVALALTLLSIWFGLETHDRPGTSIIAGALAGFSFVTYSGYWVIDFLAACIHLVRGRSTLRSVLQRGLLFGLGGSVWPLALTVITFLGHYTLYPVSLLNLANSVNWGSFNEGWSVVWEYLWQAETGLLLVWILGILLLVRIIIRSPSSLTARAGLLWLGSAALIYALLVLFSVVLHKFVVSARVARQIVPFLCLAAAAGLAQIKFPKANSWVLAVGPAVLAAITLFNFGPAFLWQDPAVFRQRATQSLGPVGYAMSVATIVPRKYRSLGNTGLVLTNPFVPAPVRGVKPLPTGQVVLSATHPLQFRPFLYEFYSSQERTYIREAGIPLSVIDTRSHH